MLFFVEMFVLLPPWLEQGTSFLNIANESESYQKKHAYALNLNLTMLGNEE